MEIFLNCSIKEGSLVYHFTAALLCLIFLLNNEHWVGYREIRTLIHCWWGCKLVQPLWKTVWQFTKTLNPELAYNPTIPVLCLCPKRIKSRKTNKYLYTKASLFTIAKEGGNNLCPLTNKWQQNMTYTHNDILFSLNKELNSDIKHHARWHILDKIMASTVWLTCTWYPEYGNSWRWEVE